MTDEDKDLYSHCSGNDCKGCALCDKYHNSKSKKKDYTGLLGFIGIYGCFFWIALLFISVGAGIYSIRWAWWFLKYCWNVVI